MNDTNNAIVINIADIFHPHGFHRSKGKYPGEKLKSELNSIIKKNSEKKVIKIDLSNMKTLFGSFVDGAFGSYIDDYKEDFFNHFHFVEARPEFQKVIDRVFEAHKRRNFSRK